jgi:Zn-dependent peptidase ImmA (M78 family)
MLRDIVKLTQLDHKFCAGLFGVDPDQFNEWMAGNRPIPRFLLPEVASVFGVDPADVIEHRLQSDTEFAPAIWYKLRTQEGKSSPADLEIVGIVRKLCFGFSQLQALLGQNSAECEEVFRSIRSAIDQSAPIRAQARTAAKVFRSHFGWAHGQSGIGALLRPNLRRAGLVIVESPVSDSKIEGCGFRVRAAGGDVACVFANSYQSTWFRRNSVILHEVSHCIFDLEGDPVSIDYKGETGPELIERRANLFAQECLVPKSVLVHAENSMGINWSQLSPEGLAQLVASVHAEQKLVLTAALDARLITVEQCERYRTYECTPLLKRFTDRALTKREFFATQPKETHRWLFENRIVKIGNRDLLLPAGYLKAVIELLNDHRITLERAAELTMMDGYSFEERFGALMNERE